MIKREQLVHLKLDNPKLLGKSDDGHIITDEDLNPQVASPAEATLVTSQIGGSDKHICMFDLDLECELVPSVTEGHYHLYIYAAITWDHYQAILRAMRDAGLLQAGWVNNSIKRGAARLRTDKAIALGKQ